MRRFLTLTLLSVFLFSFSSCAVVQSLLGLDECAYPGCTRHQVQDCNYCIEHCNVGDFNLPDGFTKQTQKSIDRQVKEYNERQNKQQNNASPFAPK